MYSELWASEKLTLFHISVSHADALYKYVNACNLLQNNGLRLLLQALMVMWHEGCFGSVPPNECNYEMLVI